MQPHLIQGGRVSTTIPGTTAKTMAPITEMKIKEIRAAVLRRWFALPPAQRATEQQAAAFADETMAQHALDPDSGAQAMIREWLSRYTGLKPMD
jgi:hypothetical protein